MKPQYILYTSILLILVRTQLTPIKTEEEIQINLNEENTNWSEQHVQNNKKEFTKIYEVDLEAYGLLMKSFKNIVHLVQSDDLENQQNIIQNVIQNVNFTQIDVIFIKSQIGKIEQAQGLYIYHLDEKFYFDDLTDIQSKILNIISPKLQFLENEVDVDKYFSDNKIKSILLLPDNYRFKNQIIDDIEQIIRDGSLEEAKIEDIKGYSLNYKNFSAPTLLLHKGNNQFEQYEYNLTYTDQIIDFLYLESLNLINHLNEDNYARVFGGSIQTQLHLLIKEKDEELLNNFQEVALNNKLNDLKYQRIIFTYSTFEENPSLWEQFDFTEQTQTPKLVITETNFRKYQLEKYICQDEQLNAESIQKFINDFREKNLEEFFKSEPIPEQQDDILKIVGSTFTQEVLTKGRNVLVLFWDSKSPQLFDEYFNLLREFSKIQNKDKIKVGYIDLALNEHSRITIDSVPKLLLYVAADKKSPKEYLRSQNLVLSELKAWLDYYLGTNIAYLKQNSNDL